MLIGITGKKRSGKDTAGDYLVKNYGFRKARPLAVFKHAFKEWFGWDDRHMDGELKEVVDPLFGFSPRQLMQVFGTEVMKTDLGERLPQYRETCGDDIWALAFRRWYERQPPGNYVLTDLRFLREFEVIPFDMVIKMESDRSPSDTHQSEMEIDLIPYSHRIVNNNYASFPVVYSALDEIMRNADISLDTKDGWKVLFEE